jgi:hypothetical protein
MTFQGSCHCAKVRFEVDAEPTSLSECNCSLCRRKGARYLKMPEIAAVRIIEGEDNLTTYQFNTRQAKHYFCKTCGIHVFHRPRLDPARWSVNARCLEGDGFDISRYPVTRFDGVNWEEQAMKHGWRPPTAGR